MSQPEPRPPHPTPRVPAGPLPLLQIPSPLPGNAPFLGGVEVAWEKTGVGGTFPWLLCSRVKGEGMESGNRQ